MTRFQASHDALGVAWCYQLLGAAHYDPGPKLVSVGHELGTDLADQLQRSPDLPQCDCFLSGQATVAVAAHAGGSLLRPCAPPGPASYATGLPTKAFAADIGGPVDIVFVGRTAYVLVTLVSGEIVGVPDGGPFGDANDKTSPCVEDRAPSRSPAGRACSSTSSRGRAASCMHCHRVNGTVWVRARRLSQTLAAWSSSNATEA